MTFFPEGAFLFFSTTLLILKNDPQLGTILQGIFPHFFYNFPSLFCFSLKISAGKSGLSLPFTSGCFDSYES